MGHKNFIAIKVPGGSVSELILMVVIMSILLLATNWFFSSRVDRIDQQIEKIRSYDIDK